MKCMNCGKEMGDVYHVQCNDCLDAILKGSRFRNMIKDELAKAKAKHPKFCDRFHETNLETIKESLSIFREIGTDNASLILREEVAESIEAYLENRLSDCLVELAQCGAVVLRMMEFVQAEIDAKKGGAE